LQAAGADDFYDVKSGDFRVQCLGADWANQVNFIQAQEPDNVGPRYLVGPAHLKRSKPVHL